MFLQMRFYCWQGHLQMIELTSSSIEELATTIIKRASIVLLNAGTTFLSSFLAIDVNEL